MEPVGSMLHSQGLSKVRRPCVTFLNTLVFTMRLLASCQTPKLEDHSWLAIHNCLFNTFAAKIIIVIINNKNNNNKNNKNINNNKNNKNINNNKNNNNYNKNDNNNNNSNNLKLKSYLNSNFFLNSVEMYQMKLFLYLIPYL